MENMISILIVDDDPTILNTLTSIVKKNYKSATVYSAPNGTSAWNVITEHHPSIVISDLSMPAPDGIQLCIKLRSRKEFDNIYFIILTANNDKEKLNLAFEKGADDFINKPLDIDVFLSRIRAAMRIVDLQQQMKEENKLLMQLADELEHDIQDTILLAVKFLQARMPSSYDMLKRISKASVWIAQHIGKISEDELEDIEVASLLSHSGKIFLPDKLLKQPVLRSGRPTDDLMYQIPNSARSILSSVTRFEDVANILYHLYENIDGSGFPEHSRAWQIPIASRIIRVPLDYEEIRAHTELNPREILNELNRDINKYYDQRVVILFDQFIRSVAKEDFDPREIALSLAELQANMILTKDIITHNGLKLLPAGAALTDKNIPKILSHNTTDPIIGNIYVRKVLK